MRGDRPLRRLLIAPCFLVGFAANAQAQATDCRRASLAIERPYASVDGDAWVAVISVQAAAAWAGPGSSPRQAAAILLRREILARQLELRGGDSITADLGRAQGFEFSCQGMRFYGLRVLAQEIRERSVDSVADEQSTSSQDSSFLADVELRSEGAAASTGVQTSPLGQ
jgi:hypothetical protein